MTKLYTPYDSLALTRQSATYPTQWNGRVPLKIRALKTIQAQIPDPRWQSVLANQDYLAWVNSHGDVFAILDNGQRFFLEPGEFEVVEWHTELMHAD